MGRPFLHIKTAIINFVLIVFNNYGTDEVAVPTCGLEVDFEAFVGAKAIRGEDNLDFIRVSKEGRLWRSAATIGPQSPRGSVNLKTKDIK